MKSRAFLLALSCVLCGFALPTVALGVQQSPFMEVPQNAVWWPSVEQLAAIRKKCGARDPGKFGDCFLSEMGAAGASPEAIAFAKSLAEKGYGYLRDFRGSGRVRIAYVEYAFRANEMEGVYLVNGSPPRIDVDDASFLPVDELAKNTSYADLLRQHPKLMIFPGDRYHTEQPIEKSLASGAQEFVVSYSLRHGCHACAAIGELQLAFDFDQGGKFKGARFSGLTAHPPVHALNTSAGESSAAAFRTF